MFERHIKHKRGGRTFFFLYIKHGWISIILGALILFLTYHIYYGALYQFTYTFLSNHPNWYITLPALSLWLLLIGLIVLILGFLVAAEHYMHYKFILSDHAFHLNRGLFFIRETTIPYQQISNVHIARPYHYRIFGVAQLDIVTAADKSLSHDETKTKQYLIPIIDTKVARALSEQLIDYASQIRETGKIDDPEPESDQDDEVLEEDIVVNPKSPKNNIELVDEIGEIEDIRELEFITEDDHKPSYKRMDGLR